MIKIKNGHKILYNIKNLLRHGITQVELFKEKIEMLHKYFLRIMNSVNLK